jgi:hypothetical protein
MTMRKQPKNNPKHLMRFGQVFDDFIVLDQPEDRIGMIFLFKFDNGFNVSVADHTFISSGDGVSVMFCDSDNKVIDDSIELDDRFGLIQGEMVLSHAEVEAFLRKVKDFNVLEMFKRLDNG